MKGSCRSMSKTKTGAQEPAPRPRPAYPGPLPATLQPPPAPLPASSSWGLMCLEDLQALYIHLVAHEDQKHCHRKKLSEYSESLQQRHSKTGQKSRYTNTSVSVRDIGHHKSALQSGCNPRESGCRARATLPRR